MYLDTSTDTHLAHSVIVGIVLRHRSGSFAALSVLDKLFVRRLTTRCVVLAAKSKSLSLHTSIFSEGVAWPDEDDLVIQINESCKL